MQVRTSERSLGVCPFGFGVWGCSPDYDNVVMGLRRFPVDSAAVVDPTLRRRHAALAGCDRLRDAGRHDATQSHRYDQLLRRRTTLADRCRWSRTVELRFDSVHGVAGVI